MTVIGPRQLDGPMSAYLGNVHSALHDFNELLPPADTPAKELEQRSTFFMLLALYGLPPEYSAIRDQILGSLTVPTLSTAWSTLLRVPARRSDDYHIAPVTGDTSALVSHHTGPGRGRGRGGPSGSRPRPKCDHCHCLGHTIDRCWALHGRPSRPINVAQTHPPDIAEPSAPP